MTDRGVVAYHGTSSDVIAEVMRGSRAARRAFTESNVSLGGTYLTKREDLASVYATQAARVLGGTPVVLKLRVSSDELLPDEDWVVQAAETREPIPARIEKFMDDLFVGYPGEGWSLSDHYKERYDELNDGHKITWRDSWRWGGTARLARLLAEEDILEAL